ncbi:MAG: hypothetical protein ACI9C9_002963 [Marivirga sp.]|jgi:hypothetical protein
MKYFYTIFILLAFSSLSEAQILNVESVRKSANTDKDLLGQLDIRFSMNNRSSTPDSSSIFTQVGVRANLALLKAVTAYILIGDVSYNALAGKAFISNGYLHYRNHFFYQNSFSMEQFNQWQYDAGRGLNNRLLTGVGGRYEFLDSGRFRLAVGSGLMVEHEAWKGEGGAIERTLPKSSNYLTISAQFNETIIMKFTNYYQVGFDARSDLWRQRYSTDFSISFQFTKKLSFTTTFASTFDVAPIVPIKRFLFNADNGLRWRL